MRWRCVIARPRPTHGILAAPRSARLGCFPVITSHQDATVSHQRPNDHSGDLLANRSESARWRHSIGLGLNWAARLGFNSPAFIIPGAFRRLDATSVWRGPRLESGSSGVFSCVAKAETLVASPPLSRVLHGAAVVGGAHRRELAIPADGFDANESYRDSVNLDRENPPKRRYVRRESGKMQGGMYLGPATEP